MVVANWMRSGWGYRVRSQEHLLRTIDRIGTYKAGRRFIWRGLPDAKYDLQSSLGLALEREGIAAGEAAVRSRELQILQAALDHGRSALNLVTWRTTFTCSPCFGTMERQPDFST
jgi:hypothetical protein